MAMQVFVECPDRHCVTFNANDTIEAVKHFASSTNGVSVDEQYIMFGGQPIESGTLESHGVSTLSTLIVNARMCGGAKHGKNTGMSAVYGNFERKKDASSEGYGSRKRRSATYMLQAFDCCNLSSSVARNPVISPGGYLFDKQNILENMIHQKQEMKLQMAEYESQRARWEKEQDNKETERKKKELTDFMTQERSATSVFQSPFEKQEKALSEAGKMLLQKKETQQTDEGKIVPKLPSYWLPEYTPNTRETEIKPPSLKTTCPITGVKLRVKDLIPVKFTPADKHSKQALAAREERYVCALTQKVLRNSIACVVLKPTGTVITEEAYTRLVKPDMVDPISGKKLKESDIIKMVSAGTGYAEKGGEIKKAKSAAQMVG